jgi:hypothetical protein
MLLPYPLRLTTLLMFALTGLHLVAVLLIWRPAPPPDPHHQIVYSSSIGQTANTYILSPDASRYQRLTLAGQPLTLASCSVNGQRLTFVSGGRVHLVQVQDAAHWSAPLDRLPFRPVALMAFNDAGVLAVSRPGETVYFRAGDGGRLESAGNPLAAGAAVTMTTVERYRAYNLARLQPPDPALPALPPEAHTWDSTWSPDGSLLAYPTLIRGRAAIHLWDARTRQRVQFTFMPGTEYRPTWSPDGRQLAFLTDQVSYADFYTAAISSTAPTLLFSSRDIYPYLCFLAGMPVSLGGE